MKCAIVEVIARTGEKNESKNAGMAKPLGHGYGIFKRKVFKRKKDRVQCAAIYTGAFYYG